MAAKAVEVIGMAEARQLLTQLPRRVEGKANRAAVMAGAKPVLRVMKSLAVKASGLLKKSLARKVKSKKGSAFAVIGARKGMEAVIQTSRGSHKQVPSRYLHLVEKGTRAHAERMKNGQIISHPGAKAHPFVEPAWEQSRAAAEAAMQQTLKATVLKEAMKLGRR